MKVLVVGTGGELAGSGITTMADQMVQTLAEMGHEPIRVVVGARRRERPNRLNLENVWAVFSETIALARASRRSSPHLVWLHTFGVPTLPALRTLLQTCAVRATGPHVIVELHAFALAEQLARGGKLQRWALRWVGRLAHRLVVLQEDDAAPLRAVVEFEKVAVLANWVDVPPTPPPLPPGPPYTAVFVGSLVERKGVPQLLDAMRLLTDLPLCLRLVGGAGDGGAASMEAVKVAAVDLVETGKVVFVGEMAPAAVMRELAAAHLLVLPSTSEGMPRALLEAFAQGRSAVVGSGGNMAALVQRHRCGTLTSQDPVAIAAALEESFVSFAELARSGERAHAACRDLYSSGVASRVLQALLEG